MAFLGIVEGSVITFLIFVFCRYTLIVTHMKLILLCILYQPAEDIEEVPDIVLPCQSDGESLKDCSEDQCLR